MSNSSPSPLCSSPAEDSFNLFDVPNATGSPERRLLLAILERAILDYVGNDHREISEAEEWIFGDLDSPSFSEFTFAWVCQELDLDIQRIARSILDMPKRGSKRVAPWYFSKSEMKSTNIQKLNHASLKKNHKNASKVIEVDFSALR